MIPLIDIYTVPPKPIAYTDFTAIYVTVYASDMERHLLRKRELSRIYLQHKRRRPTDADPERWQQACDMEIAYHIFTDHDQQFIDNSQLLRHIISKHDCPDGYLYAEQFYEQLADATAADDEDNVLGVNSVIETDDDEGHTQETTPAPEDMEALIGEAQRQLAESLDEMGLATDTARAYVQQKEAKKYSLAGLLEASINKHLHISRQKGYQRPPRRETRGLLLKGTKVTKQVPKLVIYVDRSGSFDAIKTAQATQKLLEITAKYRARLTTDVYWFNDTVQSQDPLVGSGDTNYRAVCQHIQEASPEMVVVITDDDTCGEMPPLTTDVIVYPVGCESTQFAKAINCQEVRFL